MAPHDDQQKGHSLLLVTACPNHELVNYFSWRPRGSHTVLNGSAEVPFPPHSPLEEGLCMYLTHAGLSARYSSSRSSGKKLSLSATQLGQDDHGMPEGKGIWQHLTSAIPGIPPCPSDADLSSVSFSKS